MVELHRPFEAELKHPRGALTLLVIIMERSTKNNEALPRVSRQSNARPTCTSDAKARGPQPPSRPEGDGLKCLNPGCPFVSKTVESFARHRCKFIPVAEKEPVGTSVVGVEERPASSGKPPPAGKRASRVCPVVRRTVVSRGERKAKPVPVIEEEPLSTPTTETEEPTASSWEDLPADDEAYGCPENNCSYECASVSELSKHRETHASASQGKKETTHPNKGEADDPGKPPTKQVHNCQYCVKSFGTKGGLTIHKRKTHPDEHNRENQQRKENESTGRHSWDESKHLVMANLELSYGELVRTGTLNSSTMGVNMFLQLSEPFKVGFSINQISMQRKGKKYQDVLRDRRCELARIARLQYETPIEDQINVEEEEPSLPEFEAEPEDSKFEGKTLDAAYAALKQGDVETASDLASKVVKHLQDLSTDTKPKPPSRSRPDKQAKIPKKTNKRALRKQQYATTQKLWHKNRASCVKKVLSGRWTQPEPQPAHTPGQLHDTWSGIFGKPSPKYTGKAPPRAKITKTVGNPFTVTECSRILKEATDSAVGPDGVKLPLIREAGPTFMAKLMNIFLFTGKVPSSLKVARTILIPKSEKPSDAGDYRPISISSHIYRVYTSALGKRLSKDAGLNQRQRGFIAEDGCRDNLILLETIIAASKESCSGLNMAFVDMKKAFDSVSHSAIAESLDWFGVPKHLADAIKDLYVDCTTSVGHGEIKVTRGVKQGDPLSSILFNMCLEMALSNIDPKMGIRFKGHHIFYLAFADDLVILSPSAMGLQSLLDDLVRHCGDVGLEPNPKKCSSLSIVPDGRNKVVFVDDRRVFHLSGAPMGIMGAKSTYKYLGIDVGFRPDKRVIPLWDKFNSKLNSLTRAPLKPQQRMLVVRQYLIPQMTHVLVFSDASKKLLNRMDVKLRLNIRKWLGLPNDTHKSMFAASPEAGGLGIPSLTQTIPLLRLRRLAKLGESGDVILREVASNKRIQQRLTVARKHCKVEGLPYCTKEELKARLSESLWASADGRGLRNEQMYKRGLSFIRDGAFMTGKAYVSAVAVRGNLLQTPARLARGRLNRPGAGMCHKCHEGSVATLGHILQSCPKTHGLMVQRHDSVVTSLVEAIRQTTRNKRVFVEPRIKRVGDTDYVKPDIIVVNESQTYLIDVQILADAGCVEDLNSKAERKTSKYDVRPVHLGVDAFLKTHSLEVVSPIKVHAFTLDWRGKVPEHTESVARELGVLKALEWIVPDMLLANRSIYTTWNKSTSRKGRFGKKIGT